MPYRKSRRRHTRCLSDWSSDVCSSDLVQPLIAGQQEDSWVFRLLQRGQAGIRQHTPKERSQVGTGGFYRRSRLPSAHHLNPPIVRRGLRLLVAAELVWSNRLQKVQGREDI